MQVPDAAKSGVPRGQRNVAVTALVCWAIGTLVFSMLPAESDGRFVVAISIYCAAASFVLACVARTVSKARGRQKLFWGLLAAGLVASFAGDLGWSSLQESEFAVQNFSYQHVAYLVSYLLLGAALLCLVGSTTNRITLITALDSMSIMLSSGTLVWYFFLGPIITESGSGGSSWGVLAVLSWPLFDAALLFLSLVTLSTVRRPPFASLLIAGFLAFVVADGLYLAARSENSYANAGWSDMFWSLGLVFLGLAALRAAPVGGATHRIAPWRIFAFWLGPLSPSIHLGIVLVWAATHPPLPSYVAVCSAILLLYLALRVSLVSLVSRRLAREQEETAREMEQSRLLYELHDTVKQNVHGISLTLRAALETERCGDRQAAREMFERALGASREAEFRISRPYDELQSLRSESPPRAGDFLGHRLRRFEEYFGVKTHDDLQSPLEVLSPAETAAFIRVFVEACWNVAKHSGARNLYLESRRVGSLLIIRIRDDGRGFDTANPPPGLGLQYMRRRAKEVGARLDVISTPGRGTTVQVRFDTH